MADDDENITTTAPTKTKKGKATAGEDKAGLAERLVLEAANARKSLRTPRGTELRLDFLGETLAGHPEEGAGGDPCPVCRSNRGIRFTPTNELKPDSQIEWTTINHPGEYTYSATGLSMTPRTEKIKTYKITGYSRKCVQTCNCGAAMGHVWQYAPECHGLSLVQVYHRF
jgi:hypothetical protein